jgi:hypothetical protein
MAGAASTFGSGGYDSFTDGVFDPAIADAVNRLQSAAGIFPPNTAIPVPIAQSFDDTLVTTTLLVTTGTVQVTIIGLVKGQVINKINLNSGTASSTQTHKWAAITTASSTVSGVVQAVSADGGTAVTASSAVETYTLTAPWTVPTTGNYYVHVANVATGTAATFDAVVAVGGVRATQFPIVAGTGATSVTTPPAVGATLSTALTATKGLFIVLS